MLGVRRRKTSRLSRAGFFVYLYLESCGFLTFCMKYEKRSRHAVALRLLCLSRALCRWMERKSVSWYDIKSAWNFGLNEWMTPFHGWPTDQWRYGYKWRNYQNSEIIRYRFSRQESDMSVQNTAIAPLAFLVWFLILLQKEAYKHAANNLS